MSPHHQLRSRVVHHRFIAAAALANAIALVVTGFTPKGTDHTAISPYIAAINGIFFVVGIFITVARKDVHRSRVRGILVDLLFAILVPAILLMATGVVVMLMKPDSPTTVTKSPASK